MKKTNLNLALELSKRFFRFVSSILILIIGHIVLIYAGIYIGVSQCHSQTIYYGQEVEVVDISHGVETIFRFNEPVKTITRASKFSIGPADKTNPNYSVISIRPLFSKGESKITFLLANGAVVNTKIVVISKKQSEKIESFYDFVPKSSLIKKEANAVSNISDLDLMKAMIRKEEVVGMKQRPLSRLLLTGVKGMKARLVRIYTGAKFNGYVFEIKNTYRTKKYKIDLRLLTLGDPNLALLSQVDDQELSHEESTFLRVVAKRTALYYNINLPIGPIESK